MIRLTVLGSSLILLALPLVVSAANTPSKSPTVAGWSKAHFGMTPAEISSAFGGEISKVDPPDEYEDGKYTAPIEIRDTKVGPIEHAHVRFLFPADTNHPRLQRIYVTESI